LTELALEHLYGLSVTEAEIGLPWFALHVRSRSEQVVAASLHSKGYQEFLPLYRVRNRWSDRLREVDLPMFPGYVFCRFDPARRLPIVTTPSVVSVVGLGKMPQPVETAEIEAIQALAKSGLPALPWPYLRAGAPVRIERGALEGLEGILTAVKNEYRVVLSITLLHRSVAVEIDRDWVRPISRPDLRPCP
jgi:transcription antitermination factor NusG